MQSMLPDQNGINQKAKAERYLENPQIYRNQIAQLRINHGSKRISKVKLESIWKRIKMETQHINI